VLAGGPDFFSDRPILSVGTKEQKELVRGIWLYEIADLAGMKRADVEAVKVFASCQNDRGRPAYGRSVEDQPRRRVFFGTTNRRDYLKSDTGNRRFWPVKVGRIDIAALKRDRDQIWAEAVRREAEGHSLVLAEELRPDAAAVQESRREHDPWTEPLLAYAAANALRIGRLERIHSEKLIERVRPNLSDRIRTTGQGSKQ
jgi:predicted P-loop ATPase